MLNLRKKTRFDQKPSASFQLTQVSQSLTCTYQIEHRLEVHPMIIVLHLDVFFFCAIVWKWHCKVYTLNVKKCHGATLKKGGKHVSTLTCLTYKRRVFHILLAGDIDDTYKNWRKSSR